jgi:hypothetical protein
MRAVIRESKPSLLIGISGVWKGFFITASAYASYTFWSTSSAVLSLKDVKRTNLVPILSKKKKKMTISMSMWKMKRELARGSEKNGHLEGLALDDLCS